MYNVSPTYLAKIVEPSRFIMAKVDIGGVILDETIISSFEVENSMGSDRMPTIGSSIAGKLKLTVLNDASVPANLTNVDIKPYVAVQTGTKTSNYNSLSGLQYAQLALDSYEEIGSDGVFEWIPLGVFRAETGDVVRNKMTIDIECFDKMTQLDTITYQTELEFPTDTLSMLTDMASNYGLVFSTVPASVIFSERPEGSVRQVLTNIASLLSTNVKIDRLGKIKFVFTNTVAPATFTFDDNNYIDFSLLSNSLVKISQLRVGEELITGDDTGISLMFENPAVTEQSVLETIFNRVYPLEFHSYKMTLQGMPHLDDGDIVTFTDVFGIVRTIIVANHKISYTGGLRSEIGCDAPQSESKEVNVTSGSTVGNSLKNHSKTFEEAIRNATKLLSGNAGGNFVIIRDENDKPVEFLIMDTDNIETAQNVWKWNINGLGHGSDGYYGDFETAITSAGEIVANFITAGELNAEIIKTGRLSALNGNAWIDLDDGTFHFSSGDLSLGTDGIKYGGENLEAILGEKLDVSEWETLTNYISFDPAVGLTIGDVEARNKIIIEGKNITFYDESGNATATITGNTLIIENARIRDSFTINSHKFQAYNSDITYVTWIG